MQLVPDVEDGVKRHARLRISRRANGGVAAYLEQRR
jgi:hypothetical protein